MALGEYADITLSFDRIQKLSLPGLYQPDYNGWKHLYVGGKGYLWAGAVTDKGLALPTSPNIPQVIGCGTGDKLSVTIPLKN